MVPMIGNALTQNRAGGVPIKKFLSNYASFLTVTNTTTTIFQKFSQFQIQLPQFFKNFHNSTIFQKIFANFYTIKTFLYILKNISRKFNML